MTELLRQLAAKLSNMFVSARLKARYKDGRIQVTTPYGRTIENTESFPYGFYARAKTGQVVVLCAGGNFDSITLLPTSSHEGTPDLQDGDVALYAAEESTLKSSIVCRADGTVEIQGSDYGGIVKVRELQAQLAKNNQILQTILSVLATPVMEAGNGSPSAFQAALSIALASAEVADFSQIASDRVKHGSN